MALYPEDTSDANFDPQSQEMDTAPSSSVRRKSDRRKADLDHLAPEEAAKRERVRLAARERQRKHRAGIKAKRMAELGMAIVNEGGGIEQTAIGYTINENGQYEAVLADPAEPNPTQSQLVHPCPLPQAHATPGQMFASTLLLGLTCTPNLKQQLLRTLRSTPEELAAFEPFIAAAFDHWNHGRSLHYAAQGHPSSSNMPAQSAPYSQPYPPYNERFQRPLMATFPISPRNDVARSPSLSEESGQGHGDSELRVEHEPSQSRLDISSVPVRFPDQDDGRRLDGRNGNQGEQAFGAVQS